MSTPLRSLLFLPQGALLHAIQMAKAETAVYGGVQAAFSNKALAKAVAASEFPEEGVRLPINFHGEQTSALAGGG